MVVSKPATKPIHSVEIILYGYVEQLKGQRTVFFVRNKITIEKSLYFFEKSVVERFRFGSSKNIKRREAGFFMEKK